VGLKEKLQRLVRALKRDHPDVYEAVKKYCEEKGYNIGDVVAAATSAWLSAQGDEARAELEEALKSRRVSMQAPSFRQAVDMMRDVMQTMADMFRAVNEVRAGVSTAAMLADFKAMADFLTEVRTTAAESGKGSIEDFLWQVLLAKIAGSAGIKHEEVKKVASVRTGTGKVIKVGEEGAEE